MRRDDDRRFHADRGGDRQAFAPFLGLQNHSPQMMIRWRPERQFVLTQHQHAVNRHIANAGIRVFADLHADGDIRAAIFARVGDDGQLGQIDLIAGPFDFFARSGGNDLGRDTLIFQSQIALEHLLPRHTETESDKFSRREQATQHAPTGIVLNVLEQERRPFDVRGLAHARRDFVLDAHLFLNEFQLTQVFQVGEKTS